MKVDRLMAILVYLLDHGTASASTLAVRFEVSRRTIQRDMDALGLAGIPVMATHGKAGGYRLMDGFAIDRRLLTETDLQQLRVALSALDTARGDSAGADAAKKLIGPHASGRQTVRLDLSAARETARFMPELEAAIDAGQVLRIAYEDAKGEATLRDIEPLQLAYEWYAWYVLAYCRLRGDYRQFKLSRIVACQATAQTFDPAVHEDEIAGLIEEPAERDMRAYVDIALQCRASTLVAVEEYLTGAVEEIFPNGDFTYYMCVPAEERLWFSLLLSFGDAVEVISPDSLRERIRAHAEALARLYR